MGRGRGRGGSHSVWPHEGCWVTWRFWGGGGGGGSGGRVEFALKSQYHESLLFRTRKPNTAWLGDVWHFQGTGWNVLGLDLRGGCTLLPTLTPHPTQSFVVDICALQRQIVLSQVSSQGTCFGLGSAIGSSSLRMPEFLGRNGSSGCPEYLTLGVGGSQGLLRPPRHLPAVIHLASAGLGNCLEAKRHLEYSSDLWSLPTAL